MGIEKGKITHAYYDFTCKVCGKETSKYLTFGKVEGKYPRIEFGALREDSYTDLTCYDCLEAAYKESKRKA